VSRTYEYFPHFSVVSFVGYVYGINFHRPSLVPYRIVILYRASGLRSVVTVGKVESTTTWPGVAWELRMTTAFEDTTNSAAHNRRRVTKCYTGLELAQILWHQQHNLHLVNARDIRWDNGRTELNSVAWVRERNIPTERPPLAGEVSANFCGERGATWSAWRIPTAVFSDF
jgi:hypothetical protein